VSKHLGRRQKKPRLRYLSHWQSDLIAFLLFLLALVLLLVGFFFIPIRVPSGVPYTLHSILLADYSADLRQAIFPGASFNLIEEAFKDLGTPVAFNLIVTPGGDSDQGMPGIFTPTSGGVATASPTTPVLFPLPTAVFPTPTSTDAALMTPFQTPEIATATIPSVSLTPQPGITFTFQPTPTSTLLYATASVIPPSPTSTSNLFPSATPTTPVAVTQVPATGTRTPTPTGTPVPTRTPTPTHMPTNTFTPLPTWTRTPTPTRTPTRTPTSPPTPTPRPYPAPDTPTPDPYP